MLSFKKIAFTLFLAVFYISASAGLPKTPLGLNLEGYHYPYPVHYFDFDLEGKPARMAYMDIRPARHNTKGVVVLLHGGLAMGAYWQNTIEFLSQQGYRVIAPDQIGFGKSTKTNTYYSFFQLSTNTKQLLDHLKIKHMFIVGHSMGGMLAIRFSLMYPNSVNKLFLEDPLGLEDYRLSIPYKTPDQMVAIFVKNTWQSIENQHKELYAHWEPRYRQYALLDYRQSLNPNYKKLARAHALIYEMIYEQPVAYELSKIKAPTFILYGSEDHVVPGKAFAPPLAQQKLGDMKHWVNKAAKQIPNVKVHENMNVGHISHIESPTIFNQILSTFLHTNKGNTHV
ncbi:MAG: alpha/beta hydrolase [Coxiellaceae bacterium]|nr:alpha/beta hydrolase [Coxiellaceae bacterium]